VVRKEKRRGKACLAFNARQEEKQLTMNTPIVKFEDL
jgi:hypothetical protein